MKIWQLIWTGAVVVVLSASAMAEEARRGRAPLGDRTPLITAPDPDAERNEEEQPVALDPEEREELTLEERVEELEFLVDRHNRMLDPYNHRDEWRLERRLRDLEKQMEEVKQELRRIEERLRRAELRR